MTEVEIVMRKKLLEDINRHLGRIDKKANCYLNPVERQLLLDERGRLVRARDELKAHLQRLGVNNEE